MTGELRTALAQSFTQLPHGSRVASPKLNDLCNNMLRVPAINHFCEHVTFFSLGFLHFAGIDAARRFPQTLDSILCGRVTTRRLSLDELQKEETRIEGKLNDLQMAYATGDKSTRTKQQMLEDAKKHREALDNLIRELERDLYGEKQ